MNKKQTILIGGQPYNAITGLPVVTSTVAPSPVASPSPVSAPTPVSGAKRITVAHSATKIHATTQRSVALNRKFVGKPKTLRTDITTTHRIKPVASQAVHTQTHPQVRRFAPHPIAVKTHKSTDIAPVTHPHVAKAHALSAQKAAQPTANLATHIPSKHVKQHAISHAVANTPKPNKEVKTHFWQKQRASSIIAATFALVLLGGYFTYLNMPSLSVRVAAAQAGIDASYPDYRPDGYALNGPVTYTDGRVSMNFKANASDAKFSVNQSESGWDSSAVLDNYVLPRSGSSYMPFTERGLTIYTFNNNAAWVNGGILYTIDGDAPLSNEQIRRIATSLL